MKNLVILLVVILIAAVAFFALKGPDLTPIESEYLDFKLGAKASPEMKATEESDKFKTKTEIYYSVFSKKPFEADATVEVVIKNTADMSKVAFTESLGTIEKKVMRPINPVNSDVAGKYVIELVKSGAVIARKVFTVSDDVQAPAPAAPVALAPATPATGEVKVKAPAVPATVTGEVQPK